MSTFAKSFKDEVIRLARKEAKAAVAPIRKPSGANRSALADLKRRVSALEKETRRLSAELAKVPQPAAAPATGDEKARIIPLRFPVLRRHPLQARQRRPRHRRRRRLFPILHRPLISDL